MDDGADREPWLPPAPPPGRGPLGHAAPARAPYDPAPLDAALLDPALAEAVDDAVGGWSAAPVGADRVVGADPHDFAGLYIRHRAPFAAHARRFLRDQRDVDEVVQEAFLRLFLALPELETELQALSYCRRTITNLCIDRYRADLRRPRLVDLDSVPVDALPDDELDDPVVQAEDAAVVRHALSLLSPHHREALIKREVEEKPLPVIAREMAIPEDRVKHLLHRARRALRRHLAETYLAPGVDLDRMSTLSLLARGAGASAGRLGVLVLLCSAVALGASGTGAVEVLHTVWGDGWGRGAVGEEAQPRRSPTASTTSSAPTARPPLPGLVRPVVPTEAPLPRAGQPVAPAPRLTVPPRSAAAVPAVAATPPATTTVRTRTGGGSGPPPATVAAPPSAQPSVGSPSTSPSGSAASTAPAVSPTAPGVTPTPTATSPTASPSAPSLHAEPARAASTGTRATAPATVVEGRRVTSGRGARVLSEPRRVG